MQGLIKRNSQVQLGHWNNYPAIFLIYEWRHNSSGKALFQVQWSKQVKKEMDVNQREVRDESLNAVLVLGDCGGQQYYTPVKSLNRKAFRHHAQTVTSFHEHFTLKKILKRRAGKAAQCVRVLCKHKGLSYNPLHQQTMQGQVYAPVTSLCKRQQDHLYLLVVSLAPGLVGDSASSELRQRVTAGYTASLSGLCVHTHTCSYTVYTHTHN